jgi:hypothetical protein
MMMLPYKTSQAAYHEEADPTARFPEKGNMPAMDSYFKHSCFFFKALTKSIVLVLLLAF